MFSRIILGLCIPIFLFSENLSELINISIKNRLINSSIQNLHSIENSYESTKNGYLPNVNLNARYSKSLIGHEPCEIGIGLNMLRHISIASMYFKTS